jgi:protein tyrosine/serine phosphatase
VLNLNYEDGDEEKVARSLGLKYFKASWSGDGIVTEKDLQWAYKIITKPENQPILIHCARGTSRTGVVVAYYRLRHCHWSRARIREEMLHYRHQPERNAELEALIDGLFDSRAGK